MSTSFNPGARFRRMNRIFFCSGLSLVVNTTAGSAPTFNR